MCVYSKSNDAIAALNETNHQNNVGKNMKYGKLQTTIFEATFTQLCAAKLEDNLDFSHIYEYVHNTHFCKLKTDLI